MYQLRRGFDDQWNPDEIDWNNDTWVNSYQQARAQLDAQIRQQLGEDRYMQYKRGSDPDYHTLNAAVSRYNLPHNRANEAYDVKLAVQQMSAEIRANASMSAPQQDEAVAAIKAEEEATLRQLLGNAGYRYVQQRSK